jgi:hypothetical protein
VNSGGRLPPWHTVRHVLEVGVLYSADVWARVSLHRLINENLRGYKFIVVSNREPYIHHYSGGRIGVEIPGGMARKFLSARPRFDFGEAPRPAALKSNGAIFV